MIGGAGGEGAPGFGAEGGSGGPGGKAGNVSISGVYNLTGYGENLYGWNGEFSYDVYYGFPGQTCGQRLSYGNVNNEVELSVYVLGGSGGIYGGSGAASAGYFGTCGDMGTISVE